MKTSSGKVACITLDLEHDHRIPEETKNPTFDYVNDYIHMVSELDIPISIFVVGKVIEWEPEMIQRFTDELDVEFHLHSYTHDITKSTSFEKELTKGIESFEDFFARKPTGYRAPQGNIEEGEFEILERHGFEFDSSVFPSYRPGVYNNLRKPTDPYYPSMTEELIEIPFSVVPRLRIPIAQNYIKLLGDPYRYLLKSGALPDLVVYDSHMQDFYRTEYHDHMDFPLKQLTTRNIHRSKEIFKDFVMHLRSEGYEFITISDLVREYT